MPRGVYARKPRASAHTTRRYSSLGRHVTVTHDAPAVPLTIGQPGPASAPEPILSRPLAVSIEKLRQPFGTFVTEHGLLSTSRASLAPPFMQAFQLYETETGKTFVDYVRLFDPSLPAERDAYRASRVYMAADYLRRKVAEAERASKPAKRGPKPATPFVALARFVATFLPGGTEDPVWHTFAKAMHWGERQNAKLQAIIETEGGVKVARRALKIAA